MTLQRKRSPKQISTIFSAQPANLQKIFKTADVMGRMQKTLTDALPPNLKEVTIIRYFRRGVLAVNVPSGVCATMIRMHENNIIRQLKNISTFSQITRIEVKVRPQAKKPTKEKNTKGISEENARLLQEIAGTTEDDDLQKTLERLATRVRKGKTN